MTLRAKLIIYLIGIHLVFLLSTIFILIENRLWLFVVEGFFLLSFLAGWRLIRSMLKPIDLVAIGSDLIEEGDFSATFLNTGQPELDRLIHLYNDMIKKLRGERLTLEEQHLFLHKLIQAAPSGIIILDYDDRIERVNPSAERLLEAPNAQLAGKALNQSKTPLTDILASLGPDESTVVRYKGNRRLKCTKSQFLDRGFQRHFILIEELTEEIRRSEKSAYEKLIRLLSHEVSNSVGAVNSLLQSSLYYIDQIRDSDREDFESTVNVSISRLGSLNEFMKGYADIIRLPDPTMGEHDVLELVRNCAQLFHRESEDKKISWRWELSEEIPPRHMDKSQMEQVIINIIKNAMEAIGTAGMITLKSGRDKLKYFLTIEDSGGGISEEVRRNLFTPFFSTKDFGQGIGLTLVQEILNRHHFDFSLEGKPGNPTCFTIYF